LPLTILILSLPEETSILILYLPLTILILSLPLKKYPRVEIPAKCFRIDYNFGHGTPGNFQIVVVAPLSPFCIYRWRKTMLVAYGGMVNTWMQEGLKRAAIRLILSYSPVEMAAILWR
jgi:hypothetical protein